MNTKQTDKTATASLKLRLDHIRTELRAERISYGELAELQDLAKYIEPGDVELLEAAGVPETATAAPEAPTEHDCPECGEHFSTCVCDEHAEDLRQESRETDEREASGYWDNYDDENNQT